MPGDGIVLAVLIGAESPTPPQLTIDGKTYRGVLFDKYGRLVTTFNFSGTDDFNANANYGAAQTDTVVISAPGSGLAIIVTGIVFSTAVAGNFYLHFGTSGGNRRFGPHYFDVNSGISHAGMRPGLSFQDNNPVRITTNIAGNHSIDLHYVIGPSS